MNIHNYLLDKFPLPYFVEAGAHDGVGDSQTLILERYGWDGVCVEPSSAFEGMKKWGRRCKIDNRALWSHTGLVKEFMEVEGTELSGLTDTFNDNWDRQSRKHILKKVETVSLHDLLEFHKAPKVIQFLCLDTEGSEAEILSQYDIYKNLILTMSIEYNGVKSQRERILQILDDIEYSPYNLEYDDGINLLMVYQNA